LALNPNKTNEEFVVNEELVFINIEFCLTLISSNGSHCFELQLNDTFDEILAIPRHQSIRSLN